MDSPVIFFMIHACVNAVEATGEGRNADTRGVCLHHLHAGWKTLPGREREMGKNHSNAPYPSNALLIENLIVNNHVCCAIDVKFARLRRVSFS